MNGNGLKGPMGAAAVLLVLVLVSIRTDAHDRETTSVTWSETVSKIVARECGACHRDGGTAFSLMSYDAARPWAVAIRDEILARTMPPWGGVQGFGEFRNDGGLSPAQTNLIVSWVEGGVPEGAETGAPEPSALDAATPNLDDAVFVTGASTIEEDFTLDGIWPQNISEDQTIQVTAELPTGRVEPLLWLYRYREEFSHPFLLRRPLMLPAGTCIAGVSDNVTLALLLLD